MPAFLDGLALAARLPGYCGVLHPFPKLLEFCLLPGFCQLMRLGWSLERTTNASRTGSSPLLAVRDSRVSIVE